MCDSNATVEAYKNAFNYFVNQTDLKNLKAQHSVFVGKAIDVEAEELARRRNVLKDMLENEADQYEAEFSNKMLTRIDDGIKERRNVLVDIDTKRKAAELENERLYRMQAQINRSYDIRDAISRRMTLETRRVLEEQMLEKERRLAREKMVDKYWQRVEQVDLQRQDKKQEEENCLKKKYNQLTNHVVGMQQAEHQFELEKTRAEKREEAKKINELIEQIRLDDVYKERNNPMLAEKKKALAKSLLDAMEAKVKAKQLERDKGVEERYKLMKEVQCMEAEDIAAHHRGRLELYQLRNDNRAYMRQMREFNRERDRLHDECQDELKRVDECTRNKKMNREERVKVNKAYFSDLKEQVRENAERAAVREEAERCEPAITYNPFDREDTPRATVLERKYNYRKELDKQRIKAKEVRAAEDAWHAARLPKPVDDENVIAELTKMCEFEGVDYLPPHANWWKVTRNKTNYTNKPYIAPIQQVQGQPTKDWCLKPCEEINPKGGGVVCPIWNKRCHL